MEKLSGSRVYMVIRATTRAMVMLKEIKTSRKMEGRGINSIKTNKISKKATNKSLFFWMVFSVVASAMVSPK